MRRISTLDDISAGLDALCAPIRAWNRFATWPATCRSAASEPGFASLVSIIVSQQVSRASADAIFGRLARLVDPLTPEGLLAAARRMFREAGLSRPKQRTLLAIAEAVETASTSSISAASTPRRRSAR